MNVTAIEPTSAVFSARPTATPQAPARTGPPTAAVPATPAVQVTPAATISVTAVPASVKAEDRALYLQILKSVGGNAAAALAVLQAKEAAEGES